MRSTYLSFFSCLEFLLLLRSGQMDALGAWYILLRVLWRLSAVGKNKVQAIETHTPLKSAGLIRPSTTASLIFDCNSGWSLCVWSQPSQRPRLLRSFEDHVLNLIVAINFIKAEGAIALLNSILKVNKLCSGHATPAVVSPA
jgi:hypothetical protein